MNLLSKLVLSIVVAFLLALPLRANDSAQRVEHFALLASGPAGEQQYRSILTLTNQTPSQQEVQLEFFGTDGAPLTVTLVPRWAPEGGRLEADGSRLKVILPAQGSVQLLWGSEQHFQAAWVRKSSAAGVGAQALLQVAHRDAKNRPGALFFEDLLISEASVPSQAGMNDFTFPVAIFRSTQTDLNTAFALVNLGNAKTTVHLTLTNNEEKTVELESGASFATFFTHLWSLVLPAVFPGDFRSVVSVKSDQPLAVAVFRVNNGFPISSLQAEPVQEGSAPTGEEFQLRMGQSVWIDNGSLKITFEDISEDSRCPSDVVCVWEGQVSVVLRVERAGSDPEQITLTSRAGAPVSKDVGSFSIRLEGVDPYPNSKERIKDSDYVIRLKVSRTS